MRIASSMQARRHVSAAWNTKVAHTNAAQAALAITAHNSTDALSPPRHPSNMRAAKATKTNVASP